jgi:hypothetical protein
VTQPEDTGRAEPWGGDNIGRAEPWGGDNIVARIVAADAGHAAAIVLGLPWEQTRAALGALGPREVARLVVGARADRVPDLVDHIAPGMLPAVLAHLSVAQVGQLVPLLSMELAVRVVQHMAPPAAAELLLALPTHQRLALQEWLPHPAAEGGDGDYPLRVEQAVRRIAGRVSWLDPRSGTLLTEVFGRRVVVVARDLPSGTLHGSDLHTVVVATDWRHIAGLVVMTNATFDASVGDSLREARQRGYLVEALQWQDDRDDGLLKRVLVRLGG